ncbi:probable helicase senataxin isoform X2 [Microplitis mediator]|uniref:probable helicase senataxin isoform X2 n=1 Tax=Microplitis mediator TaxID=375433 RepID=UPI002555E9C0|nr:probable helicase senataxin isoform X2 [Microplitis mediator]
MIKNMYRNSKKIILFGCPCASAYIVYHYWKKRQLKPIDEGFEEVAKIIKLDDRNSKELCKLFKELRTTDSSYSWRNDTQDNKKPPTFSSWSGNSQKIKNEISAFRGPSCFGSNLLIKLRVNNSKENNNEKLAFSSLRNNSNENKNEQSAFSSLRNNSKENNNEQSAFSFDVLYSDEELKKEFFYQIFERDLSSLNDNRYNKNTPPYAVNSIKMSPIKLNYSSYKEYQQIMLPFLIDEFWYSLKNDILEKTKNEIHDKSVAGDVIEHSFETVSIDSDNGKKLHKITRFELTATVPRCDKDEDKPHRDLNIEDLYPSRGDIVIIYRSSKHPIQFAYIEKSDNRTTSKNDKDYEILTYTLITKFSSSLKLSGYLTITPVTWILSSLALVDSLGYIPQSPLINAILKPDFDSYKMLSTINSIPTATEETLNSKQLEVLSRVVTTIEDKYTPGICLIQGPPGTGKTKVIKNIIATILSRKSATRILVCAPSNKAIDEIVIRLLEIQPKMEEKKVPFEIVRVGREEKIHQSVQSVSLVKLAKSKKNKFLSSKRQQDNEECILQSANIIACTLTSCWTSYRMKAVFSNGNCKIPLCIIDESAQATELLTLIPLMLNIQRLILVGDPQQLPPTVISQKAKEYGYDQSLFARIQKIFEVKSKNPIIMLDTQYRMVEAISQWPNRYFYKGAIKNAASVEALNFCNYIVFNHSYSQDSDRSSNPSEAELVQNIVNVLKGSLKLYNSYSEKCIGVITPYKRQRDLLNELINPLKEEKKMKKKSGVKTNNRDRKKDEVNKKNFDSNDKKEDEKEKKENKIDVNTVDSFQGSERDVIIMSCVRSNGIGFVKDPNRLNVSLTRAKHTLILCGNFNEFKQNKMWKNLLQDAKARGFYHNISKDDLKSITKHLIIDRGKGLS